MFGIPQNRREELVSAVRGVGSEKSIAVGERLTEGPRDNHGGAAGKIMRADRGQEVVPGLACDDSHGVGHGMARIRWTGRGEEPSCGNRDFRLRAGRSGDGARRPAGARLPRRCTQMSPSANASLSCQTSMASRPECRK